jgi:mono/diheme cytochrome c family protein
MVMNGTRNRLLTSTLVLTFLALFIWSIGPAAASGPAPQEARSLYVSKCASCHAADGSGNTAKGREMKLRDLRSAEVQKLTDAKLYEIIAKGAKKMPGYEKSLGKDKCQALVGYMRELAKK